MRDRRRDLHRPVAIAVAVPLVALPGAVGAVLLGCALLLCSLAGVMSVLAGAFLAVAEALGAGDGPRLLGGPLLAAARAPAALGSGLLAVAGVGLLVLMRPLRSTGRRRQTATPLMDGTGTRLPLARTCARTPTVGRCAACRTPVPSAEPSRRRRAALRPWWSWWGRERPPAPMSPADVAALWSPGPLLATSRRSRTATGHVAMQTEPWATSARRAPAARRAQSAQLPRAVAARSTADRSTRPGHRRRILAALVLLPLLASCTTSPLDPDATVQVAGRALAPDGRPLPDRPVRLDSDLAASDLLLAVPTAGLACLGGGCGDALSAGRTGPDGRFRVTTTGERTQTSFGGLRTLALTVSGAPRPGQVTGASVTARFTAQVTEPALPDLRLVDPGLRLEASSSVVRAQWDVATGPRDLLLLDRDGRTAFALPAAGGAADLDARVLEGDGGAAVLTGSVDEATADGSDIAVTWTSPGTAYAALPLVPVSRGAACATGRDQPCQLTDGDLTTPAGLPAACADAEPCDAAVEVLLPDLPAVELVVVRGCGPACTVTVEGPTGTLEVGRTSGDAALAVPSRPVGRLRLRGPDLSALREVSAWSSVPPQQARPDVGPAAGEVFSPDREGRADPADPADRLPLPLLLLAVALLSVATAGCVSALVVLRRR